MSVKIKGAAEFKRRIAAMPMAAKVELRKALKESAQDMVSVARRMAPVSSGDLRNSIGYTFGEYRPDNANVRGMAAGLRGNHDLAVTVHAGDRKAWYAALVEFGTSTHTISAKADTGSLMWINGNPVSGSVTHPGSAPHPFFYPAYRLVKKKAAARMRKAMKVAVHKAASK